MASSHDEGNFPPIGALLHFKGGKKYLEFRGQNHEGKIILRDPSKGVSYTVDIEEIDWTVIINPKPAPP